MREKRKSALKKVVVGALSFLMAFGPSLSCAYAAEAANQLSDAVQQIVDTQAAVETDGAAENNDAVATGTGDEAELETEVASESEPDVESTQVSLDQLVDYLYIENELIGGGETQNIVVGATQAMVERGIASATLELVNVDTGAVVEVAASANTDGAYLFSHEFADEDAGAYVLQKLAFTCADGVYESDVATAAISSVFVDEDENIENGGEVDTIETDATESGVAHYGFDVVRAETAASLREADGVSEEEDYDAFVVGEDGTLEATASVEEALAQGEPAATAEAGDSVEVTDEMLAEASGEPVAASDTAAATATASGTEADSASGSAGSGTDATADAPATTSDTATTYDSVETILDDAVDIAATSEVATQESSNPLIRFFQDLWAGICGLFNAVFAPTKAYAAVSSARENYLVVAIDAGHGGYDSGATGNGLYEKNLTLSIATYMKKKLATYTGVSTFMTRTTDTYVGLQERVDNAVAGGADVFVSIHINSGGGKGVEVYVPNNSSYLKDTVATPGQQLGSKVLANLVSLGFTNRGTKSDYYSYNGTQLYYPDGSRADAFAVIRYARAAGIPGILVEAGFIDNSSDASKLGSDSVRKSIGEAVAAGVVSQYGLVTAASAQSSALVGVSAHIDTLGWLNQVYDQKVAGTTGKNLALYGLMIKLQNAAASAGGIQYRVNTGSGWSSWAANGSVAGSTGASGAIQAVQMQLTGTAANTYDVYYRVYVTGLGWMGWAKNGESAGTSGYNLRTEAVEVVLVSKGGAAPGSTSSAYKEKPTGATLTLSAPTVSASTVSKGTTVTWKRVVSGNEAGATYTYLYRYGTTGTTVRTSTPSFTPDAGGLYQVAVEAVQNGQTVTSAWTNVTVTAEKIMGNAVATSDQVKKYWNSVFSGKTYPYTGNSEAPTLDAFIDLAYAQAAKEGVRADVLLAQIAVETGWLQFGGMVKASQYNFGGIGALDTSNQSASFSSISEGLLASVQHLKAYASTDACNTAIVDPRFSLVTRGVAPYVEQLAGRWASNVNYGNQIDSILSRYYKQ